MSLSGTAVGQGRGNTTSSDYVLADAHPKGTDQKDRASTKFVDCVKTREGADNIDDIGNDLEDEGVGKGRVLLLEIACPIIHDEVDTWNSVR